MGTDLPSLSSSPEPYLVHRSGTTTHWVTLRVPPFFLVVAAINCLWGRYCRSAWDYASDPGRRRFGGLGRGQTKQKFRTGYHNKNHGGVIISVGTWGGVCSHLLSEDGGVPFLGPSVPPFQRQAGGV